MKRKVPRRRRASFLPHPPALKPAYATALMVTALAILIAGAVVLLYRVRSGPASPVQTASSATVEPVTNTSDATPAALDLTGDWSVVNTVEQTSYVTF